MVSSTQDLTVFGYRKVLRRSLFVSAEQRLALVAQDGPHRGGDHLDERGLGARLQLAARNAPEMHVPVRITTE